MLPVAAIPRAILPHFNSRYAIIVNGIIRIFKAGPGIKTGGRSSCHTVTFYKKYGISCYSYLKILYSNKTYDKMSLIENMGLIFCSWHIEAAAMNENTMWHNMYSGGLYGEEIN